MPITTPRRMCRRPSASPRRIRRSPLIRCRQDLWRSAVHRRGDGDLGPAGDVHGERGVHNSGANGATVTLTGVGSCTVTAHQAGNANYNAAPDVPQTFNIAKANQTIAFDALPNKTYGDPPFTVVATATSGLPVTFTVSGACTTPAPTVPTVTLTGVGSCTVTAHQAGNIFYNAAPDVPQTFTIARANQTITFGPLPDRAVGAPPFTVSATATSGLVVTFTVSGACTNSGTNGATVTVTGVGGCAVTAHQSGNSNYNAAPDVLQTFKIRFKTYLPFISRTGS